MSFSAGPIWLLDGNVLIALADEAHVHHTAARRWFSSRARLFATCPITQGTLVRILLHTNGKHSIAGVVATLRGFTEHSHHRFWPDAIDYLQVNWQGVLGHRQVTDAYLAALARSNGGRLATFDQGLAALHPDVVELIPGEATL